MDVGSLATLKIMKVFNKTSISLENMVAQITILITLLTYSNLNVVSGI